MRSLYVETNYTAALTFILCFKATRAMKSIVERYGSQKLPRSGTPGTYSEQECTFSLHWFRSWLQQEKSYATLRRWLQFDCVTSQPSTSSTDLEGVSRVRSAGGRLYRTTEGETMHVLVRGLTPAPTMRGGGEGSRKPVDDNLYSPRSGRERKKRENNNNLT